MSKLAFRFLFLVVALSTVPVVSTPSTAQNKEEEDPSRAFLKTLRLTLDKRDGLNKAVALADTELGARWCQSDKLDDMSVKLVAELTWLARRARRPITGLDCASIGVSRLTSSEQAMKQTATPRLISSMLYESSLMVGRLTDSEIGMIYESREPSLISLNVSDFTLAEAVASDCSGSGLVFLEGMELGALFLDVLMPMVKKKMGEEAFDGARFLK